MTESETDLTIANQTDHEIPLTRSVFEKILKELSSREELSFSLLEVVFVDEAEIIRINKDYLDHDYVTDIITFRYDEGEDYAHIEGTLFCCSPRIIEQAEEFGSKPNEEFLRVFIHGLLHLSGYDDKSEEEQKEMTAKENSYLELANSL